MLILKQMVKDILVKHKHLNNSGQALVQELGNEIEVFFNNCDKKKFDFVSLVIDSYDIFVNNSASECVAKCVFTAKLHIPEEGEIVCGQVSFVDHHLIVCVSKYFKVFVKNPKLEEEKQSKTVHVQITRIKSEQSFSIVALGLEKSLNDTALRCQCRS